MNDSEEIVREIRSPWLWGLAVVMAVGLVVRAGSLAPLEIGPPAWTLQCSDGNIAHLVATGVDPEQFRVEIERIVAKNPWELAVGKHVSIQAGRRYVLTFEGRADQKRTVVCSLREFHPAWNALGFQHEFELTPEWMGFHFEFEATGGSDNALLDFQLGGAEASVELRDVRVMPLRAGGDQAP